MELSSGLRIAGMASDTGDTSGLGHPELQIFDSVRSLLARTGLSPEPQNYELFYLYMAGLDAGLCTEVNRAIGTGDLDAEEVMRLRSIFLGRIATSELVEMMGQARSMADHIDSELKSSQQSLRGYQEVIESRDMLIETAQSPEIIAQAIEDIRRANSQALTANRRILAELQNAAMENQRLHEKLEVAERRARTDPLTGLLNRRALLDTLARYLEKDASGTLSVALVDIDNFRIVNDRWGPTIGDEVLRVVASHIANGVTSHPSGRHASIGRYGGEEFLIIFPDVSTGDATRLVDEIRGSLARKVIRRSADSLPMGRITFSAGVVSAEPNDNELALIDRADSLLYLAKRHGRDRVLSNGG